MVPSRSGARFHGSSSAVPELSGAPKAAAAQLQNVNGITLLSFDSQQIVSIGNQTSGRCSWYALRYARTILDGKPCSGSGMWSNGAVWSAAGYYAYGGSLSGCLSRLYEELQAGRPVIVHLKTPLSAACPSTPTA